MRVIKAKERRNGMRYCTYCKPHRIDAVYRSTRGAGIVFACVEHKSELADHEGKSESEHLTEADYQTWMRI